MIDLTLVFKSKEKVFPLSEVIFQILKGGIQMAASLINGAGYCIKIHWKPSQLFL